MNYQHDMVELRQWRDAELERVRTDAKRLMADAVATRDAEILRLRQEDPSMTQLAIALRVGCCQTTVLEVLSPSKHEAYTVRRREHYWRVRAAQRQAA
jgi:hypothetical protein